MLPYVLPPESMVGQRMGICEYWKVLVRRCGGCRNVTEYDSNLIFKLLIVCGISPIEFWEGWS